MRSLLDSMYSIVNAVTHCVTSQCDLGPGSTAQHGTAAAAAAATGREQLLSSPQYMQCLALMAAVLSYSTWPPIEGWHLQGRGQTGGGSDSTTAMKSSWYAQPSCYAPGRASGPALHEDLQQQQVLAAAAITAWEEASTMRDTLTEHQQELFARLGADSMTVCWAAATAADVPSTKHDSVNHQYSVGSQVKCQLLQAVADVLAYWKAQAHQPEQQQQQSTAGASAGVLQVWPELELLTAISLLPPLFVAASEQYVGFRRTAAPSSDSQLLINLGVILAALTTAQSSSSSGGSASSAAAALPLTVSAQSTLQQLRLAAIADLDSFVRNLTAAEQLGQRCILDAFVWDDPAVSAMEDLSGVCHQYEHGWDGPLLHWALAAGPGSAEQEQLCSLLASMLKFSYKSSSDGTVETVSAPQNASVAETAGMLLSYNCCVAPRSIYTESTASSTAGSQVSSVGQSTAAAAAPSASSRAASRFAQAQQLTVPWTSSAPAAASAGLPCLVLLGRCCMVWAADIAADIDKMLDRRAQMQTDPGSVDWAYCVEAAPVVCLGQPDGFGSNVVAPQERRLACYLQVMLDWLQSDGISSALSAAGYNPQAVVQQLNKVQAATEAASSPACLQAGPVYAAIAALRELGRLLCSFAVTSFCNNPSCSNVSGPTELSLVSGRCCMCGDCRIAHYWAPTTAAGPARSSTGGSTSTCAGLSRLQQPAGQRRQPARQHGPPALQQAVAITQPLPSAAELQEVVASQQQQLAELKEQLAIMRTGDDAAS